MWPMLYYYEKKGVWSPGIKLGVREGGFSHQNEMFGPVLGIMRATNLQHAIRLANGTPYGLTSGIHTLDEREIAYWMEHIVAGNAYINRGITGAIVQRQPFGGCKESSFGRGSKAGGPNYLTQMMTPMQISLPEKQASLSPDVGIIHRYVESGDFSAEEKRLWHASVGSYAYHWENTFEKDHDPSKLVGQDNFLRYIPHVSACKSSPGCIL